ncbi:MAG: hypothetical protein K8S97_10900 [Anaerolineae bacterium]|nr:hypothetical protein [Anaerolineae bacterium]
MRSRNASKVPMQMRALTRLIQREPDIPVHYLLRGEEWLVLGDLARARADFEQAQALATALLIESDWGYVLQAYLDRAEAGLRCCGAGN